MKKNEHQASALEEMMKKHDQHKVEDLPPRSQTHNKNNGQKRIKLKHPLIRFFSLCFLLVPLAVLAYMYYGFGKESSPKSYDKVQLSKNTQEKNIEEKKEVDSSIKEEEKKEADSSAKEEEKKEDNLSTKVEDEGNKFKTHTVLNGETLYTISMHYYGTRDGEALIRSINELQSNELTPGQKLKIPEKEYIEMK